MLKNKLLFIFIIFVYNLNVLAIDADKLFEEGNQFYNSQNYVAADSVYSTIDTAGYYSSELFLNLGNVNYKLGNIAKTIYNYERALKLSPGDEDIVHNLKIANKLLSDVNAIKSSKRIDDLIYTSIKSTTNFWPIFSIVLFIIGSLLILVFLIVKTAKQKKTSFYLGMAFYIFGAITIYLASLQYNKQTSIEYGIIYKPFVELKTEPSANSNVAFVLHEGTKVKVLNKNSDWYEISFNNGQIAWIEKNKLEVF